MKATIALPLPQCKGKPRTLPDLTRWNRLIADLRNPDLELDAETFAAIWHEYSRLKARGYQHDPMVTALLLMLHRQVMLTDDGVTDVCDVKPLDLARRILKPLQDAPRKVQRNGVVFEQNTAAIGRKAATSPPPPATTTDVLDDVAEDDLSPEDDDVFPVEPAPADEEFDNPFEDASPAAAPPPPKPAASKPAAAAKPATAIKADGALDERATAFNAPLLNTIKRLSESAREIRDAWGLVEGERNLKEWSNEDARDNGRASYVATIGRINDVIYAFRQTLLVARGDDGRGLTAADVATAKRQAKLN